MYTVRRGCFEKQELAKLALALGFPSNVLTKELSNLSEFSLQNDCAELEHGHSITEENLKLFLESGALNHRLEKVFNKYEAVYNVNLIVKAASLLSRRQLAFNEISTARMAFELYSMEDGSGLPAELVPISQALKLVERVMAPTRLQAEIAKQQQNCDLPSRIQMYEFFDLVVRCLKWSEAAREMETQVASHELSATSNSNPPDISKILMTTDQLVLEFLDERYKAAIFKKVDPTPVPLEKQRIVSTAQRRTLRAASKEQSRVLIPSLEQSQQRLHQARRGRSVMSAKQYSTVEENKSRSRTSLGGEYKNLMRNTCGRMSQLHWPKCAPNTLEDGSEKDPLSKSAPSILFRKEDEEDVTEDDKIAATINDICVESVHKAREAISSSIAASSLPPLALQSPAVAMDSGSTAKLSKRSLWRRLGTQSVPAVRLTPIISKDEIRKQQDRISELHWERLRKFPLS